MAASVSDILRISAQQTYAGVDDVVNVHHFVVIATPTPNTNANLMEDVAEKLSIAWANMQAHYPLGLDPNIVEGFNVTQDAPLGQISWPGPYAGGTGTGDALPQDDCALVLWGTDVKRRQGRTYLGPLQESTQNDSILNGGYTSDVGVWALDLRDETALSNGTELRLVVYSRSAGAHSLITSVRIQPLVAQQERRKRGRGS